MKTALTFFVFILFVSTFANAQNKYERTYIQKNNHFLHTASYSSGNALIYIDRDSLIENLQTIVNSSNNPESSPELLKSTTDTIISLSHRSDTTNISSIIADQKIINITLSYFSKCILNKKANILDKRTNKFVKKILVKKSTHSSKKSSTYSYYNYFLPKDKTEFMYRIERSGCGSKFL